MERQTLLNPGITTVREIQWPLPSSSQPTAEAHRTLLFDQCLGIQCLPFLLRLRWCSEGRGASGGGPSRYEATTAPGVEQNTVSLESPLPDTCVGMAAIYRLPWDSL